MKILSLFDGISCARVALDRVGIPVEAYYASEIDKYAMQISNKNYPDIVQVESVVGLDTSQFKDIDLIIGGSPCQDLSIAKKNRQGLDGERSGLFWEYVRILKEVKPKYFILENVNSMPKEAKVIITETLGVEPIMINAALVSAQNRKRLFWIGRLSNVHPNIYKKVEIPQPEDRGVLLKDILENGDSERLKSYCIDANYFKGGKIGGTHQSSTRNYTIRIGQIGKGGQGGRIYSPDGKSVGLSALGGGGGAKTGLYAVGITKGGTFGNRKTITSDKAYCLAANPSSDGLPMVAIPVALRNRGDGKKPEYNGTNKANSMTTVQTDSMVCIVKEATKKGYAIATDGQSIDLSFPTPKTRRGRVGDKVKNLMTSQNIGVFTDSIIRKLTPIECERLQSLPDDYTEGVSNTQRYKALGNAFNVDVVAHILSFIPHDKN